jgi:ATP-binding cassette subfamily B protein
MPKAWNNFLTMYEASRYSLTFCLKHKRRETLARLIISVASTLVLYLGIQSVGLIINAVQHSGGKPEVLVWPVAFFAGVLFGDLICNRALTYYQSKWTHELRIANQQDLDKHRGSLDVACFKSKRYDDLEKQIDQLPYGWYTRVAFSEQMITIFSLLISFMLFGSMLFWYKPLYALVLIAVAVPKMFSEFSLVSMWWALYESHIPNYKELGMLKRVFKQPTAFVQGKIFGQMEPVSIVVEAKDQSIIDSYNKARSSVARKKIATSVIAIFGLVLVVGHASRTVILTGGAIGTLSIVISWARTFQGNLNSIMMLMAEQWNSAKGIILIEREFKGLKPLLVTLDPIVPDFKNPHIRFDRVSFAYPSEPEKEVLHEVSFEIQAGMKVAIVGKSGNGKSTIQALLSRHYDPTKGAIYADDINLKNIEPKTWNNYVCSLTQDYSILERRVAEEIASSRLENAMDMERVQASSGFAHFHDVALEDEEGYGRQIGTDFGGREFSGGEKQRLALARMHYRDTPIIILDEPDARLDPDSASKIMENVFAIKGKTVIIITHHVSRAEHCDWVIVMGKGVIAEQGTPAELMARGGVYAEMCESDKKRLGTKEAEA